MNRRGFLSKICGLIPFGVGLSVVGGVRASKGQREATYSQSSSSSTSASVSDLESCKPNWDAVGCKGCFVGCGQFDDCTATLNRRIKNAKKEES